MNLSRGGKAGKGGAGQGMTGHVDEAGQEMWPAPATIPATVVVSICHLWDKHLNRLWAG